MQRSRLAVAAPSREGACSPFLEAPSLELGRCCDWSRTKLSPRSRGNAAGPMDEPDPINGTRISPFYGLHQAGVEAAARARATFLALALHQDVDRAGLRSRACRVYNLQKLRT